MSLHSAKSVAGMSSLMFSLQALLVRHETYIADSERERKAMAAHIEELEGEKLALEKKNTTIIEENRSLLDQLEAVNTSVAESDAHVANLQATLQSTQQELQKLSQLVSRTEWLELQLADFEREQETWQSSLEAKEESEKSAVQRWQKAQRTLAHLQDQIERIEQEAKEEKERHGEIVERMERRHAVEKELGSAAGRLKGAAALKSNNGDAGGPNVVSHFVKDILQDNAHLQMGIVELRDMLHNSNEEVESLRNQLQLHQPADVNEKPTDQPTVQNKDLREELHRANSSELHVHHHYHAPPVTPKAQTLRRPKKKKFGAFPPGHFTPPSGASTPRSSFSYGSPTPTATILQQTAASVPQSIPTRNRWSTQSNSTYQSLVTSSGPGSPQSTTNRTSSIFDRVFSDAGHDSSRPTTPDTEDPGSPVFAPAHSKRASISSFRTQSAHVVPRGGINSSSTMMPSLDTVLSVEDLPRLEQQAVTKDVIPEESEADWENASSAVAETTSSITSPSSDELQNPLYDESYYPQPLRRAASHESLLSVSGMDIHTLKARPSQLLAPYRGRGITSQAVISDTTAHATRPTAISRPSANSKNLLSGMAVDQRQPAAKSPTVAKKVGGWMFGKWGATPTASPTETTPTVPVKSDKAGSTPAKGDKSASIPVKSDKSASIPVKSDETASIPVKPAKTASIPIKSDKAGSISSVSDAAITLGSASPKKPKLRPPGINQSGPLLGSFPEAKTPVRTPVVNSLDTEALKSLLNGK